MKYTQKDYDRLRRRKRIADLAETVDAPPPSTPRSAPNVEERTTPKPRSYVCPRCSTGAGRVRHRVGGCADHKAFMHKVRAILNPGGHGCQHGHRETR